MNRLVGPGCWFWAITDWTEIYRTKRKKPVKNSTDKALMQHMKLKCQSVVLKWRQVWVYHALFKLILRAKKFKIANKLKIFQSDYDLINLSRITTACGPVRRANQFCVQWRRPPFLARYLFVLDNWFSLWTEIDSWREPLLSGGEQQNGSKSPTVVNTHLQKTEYAVILTLSLCAAK